jgi:O-antigen ligase
MEGSLKIAQSGFRVESITIGERSSRLSSAVYLLVCFIPVFATVLFGAVDTITWVFISTFWIALVVLWLADSWKGDGLLFNSSTLQVPLLSLFLLGLIQLVPFSGSRLSLDPFATRFFLLRLIVFMVFFAACLTFINNDRRLKKIVLLLIIFGTVMAFAGILQRLANPDAIYGLRQTPQAIPFGPFVNQHHFAAMMEMTTGVALGLLFGKRTGRDKQILLAIAVVIMGMAVMFTGSRGGMISFISVFGFVGSLNFFSGRWSEKEAKRDMSATAGQKLVTAIAVIALFFVIFGSVLFLGGNEPLFRGLGLTEIQDGVANGRAHFWPIALRIFLEHPILGVGFDAFGVAFTRHDTWNGFLRVEQAHNDYLQTLADAGLIGFACVAIFIYLLFRKGLAVVSDARGFRRDAAIGALAGCFGILIHSFFDFPLRTPSNVFLFLMLCAIATVSISTREKRTRGATSP